MRNFNGTLYSCCVHTPQGDVVEIVDSAGSLAVEYKYDVWGQARARAHLDNWI